MSGRRLSRVMDLVLFESSALSIACVSDTHNEDCTKHIPAADIFIHAGDMTDNGTWSELEAAYKWISALPHTVKIVVAGNADIGLDPKRSKYCQEARRIFTSHAAQNAGVYYIDRDISEVGWFLAHDGSMKPLRVYGNPCQPNFFEEDTGFAYQPHPHRSAAEAWQTAPVGAGWPEANIWVMHSPPKGHLDVVPPAPNLVGCEVEARCIARARPLLAVFGHHHSGYGVEKVTWDLAEDKVNLSEMLSDASEGKEFDLSAPDMLDKGLNTLFVNAAWMTLEKKEVEKRNKPWLIKVDFDTTRA